MAMLKAFLFTHSAYVSTAVALLQCSRMPNGQNRLFRAGYVACQHDAWQLFIQYIMLPSLLLAPVIPPLLGQLAASRVDLAKKVLPPDVLAWVICVQVQETTNFKKETWTFAFFALFCRT